MIELSEGHDGFPAPNYIYYQLSTLENYYF